MSYLLPLGSGNIIIGPFLDSTDGKTPETGLAGTMTVNLIKQGGGAGARNSAGAITHLGAGWYFVPLDATDTNTRGNLIVYVDNPSVHLPVWREAFVAPLTTYGTLLNGDRLPVDATAISGDTIAADNLEAAFEGAGHAELASIPATGSATLVQMIQYLFQHFRFKRTQTASTMTMFKADETTALGTIAVSDDGTTATRGEAV